MVPKRIRIGHQVFDVEHNSQECDALGSDGHFHSESRRIVLRDGLVPDRECEVLLHECLHAVVHTANLSWEDDDAEEKIVHAMTGPLLDLLRRNRKLVAYLQNLE